MQRLIYVNQFLCSGINISPVTEFRHLTARLLQVVATAA